MQYAKKAGYHVGAKYIMGIGGEMGGTVFEKEPPGVPGNAGAGNQVGREQSGTVETDE